MHSGQGMTVEEVLALPAVMPVLDAARALGIGKNVCYALIADDDFPCDLIRVGKFYRVSRAEILKTLGIEDRPHLAKAS